MAARSTNVVIGGEAGQGLVTVGGLLSRILVGEGYRIVVTQGYQSRIRGGHNTFEVRVSPDDIEAPAEEIDVLVNPNGPLLNGGSQGDNGQTGRKLVMVYYGPRVPIGGGALSGKDLSHIDRAAASSARQAALLTGVAGGISPSSSAQRWNSSS